MEVHFYHWSCLKKALSLVQVLSSSQSSSWEWCSFKLVASRNPNHCGQDCLSRKQIKKVEDGILMLANWKIAPCRATLIRLSSLKTFLSKQFLCHIGRYLIRHHKKVVSDRIMVKPPNKCGTMRSTLFLDNHNQNIFDSEPRSFNPFLFL